MIKPLMFRGLQLENNLFQAPLAGYSSAPFRLLIWKLGRPGLTFTEMISAQALKQNKETQNRYMVRLPEEGPVSYQLWGREPEALGRAAKICVERGADAVDLNCGCPVRKVRAAGAGSKLMEDPLLIGRIVAEMRRAVQIPVSIKIRVGPDPRTFNAIEVARIGEAEGCDWITVHGRHAGEAYGTPCRYDEIAKVVSSVNIPVIGNGDVRDGATMQRIMQTGCAGAMVGRACMGAPWVFSLIRAELGEQEAERPDLEQVGEILVQHHDLLVDLVGADTAIRQCRKLGSYYSKTMRGAREFRNKLNFLNTREELVALVREHFSEMAGN